MTAKKPQRIQYHVMYSKERPVWIVTCDGEDIDEWMRKENAVRAACDIARKTWTFEGIPTQVKIHRKRGNTIQDERTFGNDPYPPKG